MPPIRVLIVDDSAVIRRVLSDGLSTDPGIEVAATAANGQIALEKIPQVHPDIVTLDVEMPVMDGLETLAAIRKQYPKLPVIMFSTLTEHGATTTLDALARGASDYVTKPSSTGSLELTLAQIREQLYPKIKALCYRPSAEAHRAPAAPIASRPHRRYSKIEVLAIGTSTGGPNALGDLMPRIPANFPVPIVIVQHMPRLFTRLLATRLNDASKIHIQEGVAGAVLKPGEAWIAPGDFHMVVERNGSSYTLALNQDAPENSCRPAVDPLFRSVAAAFGEKSLAVILTGMGSDGVIGARHIHEQGGEVLVQDQASSVVWGMPGQVTAAGLADASYSLGALPGEITERVMKGRALSTSVPANTPDLHPSSQPQRSR